MTAALPAALAPLAAYKQFLVCRIVPSPTRPGKTDKLPCNVWQGRVGVDAHDPNNWLDADTAATVMAKWGEGYCLGFTFTERDPFWFLDLDDCLTPQGWSPVAQHLCGLLAGAAVEISHSGRGLHIFGTGRVPEHACKNVALGIELYHDKRFVALTGTSAMGNAAADCTAALQVVVPQFFPPRDVVNGVPAEWTAGPAAEWYGPTDDEDLLRRALASHSARSVFGNGATFRDLWQADEAVLARAYPSGSGDAYDRSSADAALAQHLAFWTGRDCERIERLMRRSALVREKWDVRSDYLRDRTIMGACRMQREVLRDKPVEPLAGPAPAADALEPEPASREVQGGTFLPPGAQVELFKGCVYVTDVNRILVPGGTLLKEAQFKVRYGGYTFAMDAANERTSRNAWEAFTESQVLRRPIADSVCFMPTKPAGSLVHEAGRVRVNSWCPIEVPRAQGDPSPFLNHLAKLLPNERDRHIVLYYLAACVQHQGVKFQWAPLVQGVEGNGKTLLSRAVAAAIGPRYVHWPKASQIASPFNSWLCGRTMILVEDIHVKRQGGAMADVLEELKPMITADAGYEIQAKGVDQLSTEICCNFLFNSNYKDGLVKTRNDRRFAPFYTAQQDKPDLARDGMTGPYFQQLYAWFKDAGAAIVSELLWTLPIPDEFNPATGCQRAPDTSSTAEAIEFGLGSVEQEVMEAIDQGVSGFRGGWVSSIQLDRLLDRINKGGIPINKRRGLMQSLGYDWHPVLVNGRVNNDVLPDGGKPRLYVKVGSAEAALGSAAEVARAYTAAQSGAVARA